MNDLQIDPSLMERTGLKSLQLLELIEIFSLVDTDRNNSQFLVHCCDGLTTRTYARNQRRYHFNRRMSVRMDTLGRLTTQMALEAIVNKLDSEHARRN
ncbi:hypothetical protein CcCBS67573_g10628 [Chytriomyces confervae]|uniref:Uncharacterized protein n=1 Tax=Chytriomyces confervae TaxID=246404 RepID=A0A507CMX4_9FUNG|nr:hypothetical protein CcCBS67573_g10628 [Chytriomyces confervae]